MSWMNHAIGSQACSEGLANKSLVRPLWHSTSSLIAITKLHQSKNWKRKKKNKETHTINIDKHVIQLRYIPITESCSSQHAIGFWQPVCFFHHWCHAWIWRKTSEKIVEHKIWLEQVRDHLLWDTAEKTHEW